MKYLSFVLTLITCSILSSCLRAPINLDESYIHGKWTHYADSKTHGRISVVKENPIDLIYYDFKSDGSVETTFSKTSGPNNKLFWQIGDNNHLLIYDAKDTADYNSLLHREYRFSLTRTFNDTTFHYHFRKGWD